MKSDFGGKIVQVEGIARQCNDIDDGDYGVKLAKTPTCLTVCAALVQCDLR